MSTNTEHSKTDPTMITLLVLVCFVVSMIIGSIKWCKRSPIPKGKVKVKKFGNRGALYARLEDNKGVKFK